MTPTHAMRGKSPNRSRCTARCAGTGLRRHRKKGTPPRANPREGLARRKPPGTPCRGPAHNKASSSVTRQVPSGTYPRTAPTRRRGGKSHPGEGRKKRRAGTKPAGEGRGHARPEPTQGRKRKEAKTTQGRGKRRTKRKASTKPAGEGRGQARGPDQGPPRAGERKERKEAKEEGKGKREHGRKTGESQEERKGSQEKREEREARERRKPGEKKEPPGPHPSCHRLVPGGQTAPAGPVTVGSGHCPAPAGQPAEPTKKADALPSCTPRLPLRPGRDTEGARQGKGGRAVVRGAPL